MKPGYLRRFVKLISFKSGVKGQERRWDWERRRGLWVWVWVWGDVCKMRWTRIRGAARHNWAHLFALTRCTDSDNNTAPQCDTDKYVAIRIHLYCSTLSFIQRPAAESEAPCRWRHSGNGSFSLRQYPDVHLVSKVDAIVYFDGCTMRAVLGDAAVVWFRWFLADNSVIGLIGLRS